VSCEENNKLALTFSETETNNIVAEMKTDMAPGPDGLAVLFLKASGHW
jgi:hypothetical protein